MTCPELANLENGCLILGRRKCKIKLLMDMKINVLGGLGGSVG